MVHKLNEQRRIHKAVQIVTTVGNKTAKAGDITAETIYNSTKNEAHNEAINKIANYVVYELKRNKRKTEAEKKPVLKNGDYFAVDGGAVGIFKEYSNDGFISAYAIVDNEGRLFASPNGTHTVEVRNDSTRFAYKHEISMINSELQEHGYTWKADTKELIYGRWTPKMGELYYYLLIKGACEFFVADGEWKDSAADKNRNENGNCFMTRQDAAAWMKKLNDATKEVREEMMNKANPWIGYVPKDEIKDEIKDEPIVPKDESKDEPIQEQIEEETPKTTETDNVEKKSKVGILINAYHRLFG